VAVPVAVTGADDVTTVDEVGLVVAADFVAVGWPAPPLGVQAPTTPATQTASQTADTHDRTTSLRFPCVGATTRRV